MVKKPKKSSVIISIIIANHQASQLFFQTITSILKSQIHNFELIVVNNGLDSNQVDQIKRWLNRQHPSAINLLELEAANPSRARNMGARVARGKYLLFLDNDTQVKKGWLDRAIEYLDKHPQVGAGQLKLLRMDSNRLDSAGELITANGFLVERARSALDKGQFDRADEIFSGKGAAMLVRKSVFEKIGGFDGDYIYYWEEPDLMWRVRKTGSQVRFLWMGRVYHAYGTKAKPIPQIPDVGQVYLACRNQLLTVIKNAVGWRGWRMLWWIGLSWLGLETMFLLKGKWRQAWAIERAHWWLLVHFCKIATKRRWVQKNLISSDEWMAKVIVKQSIGWYVSKAGAYISGRGF